MAPSALLGPQPTGAFQIPDTYVEKQDGGSCGGFSYRYTTVPTLQKGIAVMH